MAHSEVVGKGVRKDGGAAVLSVASWGQYMAVE